MNKILTIILVCIAVLAFAAVIIIRTVDHDKLGGVYTSIVPTNSSTTVGTTTTVVFNTATGQNCRHIYNDSTSTVYCALSNTVSSTLNVGIRLASPTNASSGPTSFDLGCGQSDFRAERITCIAGASAVVNTLQY